MKIIFDSSSLAEDKKHLITSMVKNGIIVFSSINKDDKDILYKILNEDCKNLISSISEEKTREEFDSILSNMTSGTYQTLYNKYIEQLNNHIITPNILHIKYNVDIEEFIDRLKLYSIEVEQRINAPMDLIFENNYLSVYADDDYVCVISTNGKLLFCCDYIHNGYIEYSLFNYEKLNLINIIFGNSENYYPIDCSYLINTKTGEFYTGD